MHSTCKFALAILLLALVAQCVGASPTNRHFGQQGVGLGNVLWPNGRIPYVLNMSSFINKRKAPDVVRDAAEHLALKTCVQFFELDAPPPSNVAYVRITDELPGRCAAASGQTYLNGSYVGAGFIFYSGCDHNWRTLVHEMMHILGIRHEQQRIDAPEHLKLNTENIQSAFIGQYTPKFHAAQGAYDWFSFMHYHNSGFAKSSSATTYDATRTTFDVRCKELGDGDIATIDFVTQSCWKEPMLPRCRSSAPFGVDVGSKSNKTISFIGLYKEEQLTLAYSGLPPGATTRQQVTGHGAVTVVHLMPPRTTDNKKTYEVKVTFTSPRTQLSTSCSVPVTIHKADYICNGVPSDSPFVCSGHGACSSDSFPQCECEAGFDGPFCEGVTRCPSDIAIDSEEDQQGRCLVPLNDSWVGRTEGPRGEGFAASGRNVDFPLMQRIQRQPKEISALVKFNGSGSFYLSFGHGSVSFGSRVANNYYFDDSWHYIHLFIDWENSKYTAFADGIWLKDSSFTSTSCASISNPKCTLSKVGASAFTGDDTIAIDRVRARCGGGYVSSTTSEELSAVNRILHNISIILHAPHTSNTWDTARIGDLCVATSSSSSQLMQGATAIVDISDSTKLLVTLPQVGHHLQHNDNQYITCAPQAHHFKVPPTPAATWDKKHFAVRGFCPQNGSISYAFVRDMATWYNPQLPGRPQRLDFNVDVRSATAWKVTLLNEVDEAAVVVGFNMSDGTMYVTTSTSGVAVTTMASVDELKDITTLNISVVFDWSKTHLGEDPTLVAFAAGLNAVGALSMSFSALALTNAPFIYLTGSPRETVTLSWECPPIVHRAAIPPMYPAADPEWTMSPTAPTTTVLSTSDPTTSSPITSSATTSSPTTSSPTTSSPTTSSPAGTTPPSTPPSAPSVTTSQPTSGTSPPPLTTAPTNNVTQPPEGLIGNGAVGVVVHPLVVIMLVICFS